MERFEVADINCLDSIIMIYSDSKVSLRNEGILQWGDWSDHYPNTSYIIEAILNGELFIFRDDIKILGAVVLNEQQSEEWRTITWINTKEKCLIIHALVVDPVMQGKGYGLKLMRYAEEFALTKNFFSIRLDSFPGNEKSNDLFLKLGYQIVGTVIFNSKPEGNREYYCYEKIITQRRCHLSTK